MATSVAPLGNVASAANAVIVAKTAAKARETLLNNVDITTFLLDFRVQ
jgi:hypothetical protein